QLVVLHPATQHIEYSNQASVRNSWEIEPARGLDYDPRRNPPLVRRFRTHKVRPVTRPVGTSRHPRGRVRQFNACSRYGNHDEKRADLCRGLATGIYENPSLVMAWYWFVPPVVLWASRADHDLRIAPLGCCARARR